MRTDKEHANLIFAERETKMPKIFYIINILYLFLLASCSTPTAEGVGHWQGTNHSITAETTQGKGLADLYYKVSIDGELVINQHVPRSQQTAKDGVTFSAHGWYRNKKVKAVHSQKFSFGQLYFQDKIYIDDNLVAVLTP